MPVNRTVHHLIDRKATHQEVAPVFHHGNALHPLETGWLGSVEMMEPAGHALLVPRNGINDGWIDKISASNRTMQFHPHSSADLHSTPSVVPRNEC